MFSSVACQISNVTQAWEDDSRTKKRIRDYKREVFLALVNEHTTKEHPLFSLLSQVILPIEENFDPWPMIYDSQQLHGLISTNKAYFNVEKLRGGQENAIVQNISTHNIMLEGQTGAGKSLCYQVSALLVPTFTLVVQPLISVISEQQEQENAQAVVGRFNAAKYDLNSLLTLNKDNKLIYTTPQYVNFHQNVFCDAIAGGKFSRVVFDDAHNISIDQQAYFDCFVFLARLLPFTLVTGSVSGLFRYEINSLCVRLPKLQYICLEDAVQPRIIKFIRSPFNVASFHVDSTKKTIILSLTINETERIASELNIPVFHSKNNLSIQEFLDGSINVLASTTIVSEGFDSDADLIILNEIPFSIEIMMQSVGRIGRRVGRTGVATIHTTMQGYLSAIRLIVEEHTGVALILAMYKLNCAFQAVAHVDSEMEYVEGYFNGDIEKNNIYNCPCGGGSCYKRYIDIDQARVLYECVYDSFVQGEPYYCEDDVDESLVFNMVVFDLLSLELPRSVYTGGKIKNITQCGLRPGIYAYILLEADENISQESIWNGGLYK